jgi:hypothetical protein
MGNIAQAENTFKSFAELGKANMKYFALHHTFSLFYAVRGVAFAMNKVNLYQARISGTLFFTSSKLELEIFILEMLQKNTWRNFKSGVL